MPHPADIHAGKKLKELRMLRGLTQTDVAKAAGLSFQQVQKYEEAKNRISVSKLSIIAEALNVSPLVFFEDQGNGDPAPVLDQETMRVAGAFSRITDPRLKAQARTFIETILSLAEAPKAA